MSPPETPGRPSPHPVPLQTRPTLLFTAKLEVLDTGDVSLSFSNDSQTWAKTFPSTSLAAKEAERLGVFDSAARKYYEHLSASSEHAYIDPHINVEILQLRLRDFERQP